MFAGLRVGIWLAVGKKRGSVREEPFGNLRVDILRRMSVAERVGSLAKHRESIAKNNSIYK